MSSVSFQYNDAGVRTQMVDATGTTTYSYDDVYRLTSVTFPGSRTVSYEYDDAGRRIGMTYPGGTDEVTYEYDAANRLVSVTDWNADETTYGYDNANRMTTVTFPSAVDVVSMFTYDDADRLIGIDHVQGGTTTLAFVDYTLDAVGNRTERDDDEGTHSYEYDDLYRLTEVTYPGPSTTGYVYDAFGNRTSMTVGMDTTTYSYDDADRLTSLTPPGESAITYTWDDNGNLTDRGSDEFEWDFEDRMVSATVDSAETTFAYRGDGLRESRTFNSNTVTFTWDIAAGLPVVIDDEDARYVYGAGLVSQVTSSESYYYLPDGLGSTMVTVDSDGDVVNSYTYDVFGETRSESGAQANEFQFAGQQVDGSTGLQYLRARYFDMEVGRFISREPLAALPGWGGNPYGYANANPGLVVDPSGKLGIIPPGAGLCIFGWGPGCKDDEKQPATCVIWQVYDTPDGGHYGRCIWTVDDVRECQADWFCSEALELLPLVGEYIALAPGPANSDAPTKLTGFTRHGLNNIISRDGHGISNRALLDAIKNPIKIERVVDPRTGTVAWRYYGKDAVIVLNRAGQVVTGWARSSHGYRY